MRIACICNNDVHDMPIALYVECLTWFACAANDNLPMWPCVSGQLFLELQTFQVIGVVSGKLLLGFELLILRAKEAPGFASRPCLARKPRLSVILILLNSAGQAGLRVRVKQLLDQITRRSFR